jgi:hypothetical protein
MRNLIEWQYVPTGAATKGCILTVLRVKVYIAIPTSAVYCCHLLALFITLLTVIGNTHKEIIALFDGICISISDANRRHTCGCCDRGSFHFRPPHPPEFFSGWVPLNVSEISSWSFPFTCHLPWRISHGYTYIDWISREISYIVDTAWSGNDWIPFILLLFNVSFRANLIAFCHTPVVCLRETYGIFRCKKMIQGSSVRVATSLTIGVRFSVGFFFLFTITISKPVMGSVLPPIQWVLEAVFRE